MILPSSSLPSLLQADEPPPFDILNAGGDPRIILTSEHAGDVVPRKLDLLGMTLMIINAIMPLISGYVMLCAICQAC